jgi:hypothetical protein
MKQHTVICPGCSKQFLVPATMIGRERVCNSCGLSFVLYSPTAAFRGRRGSASPRPEFPWLGMWAGVITVALVCFLVLLYRLLGGRDEDLGALALGSYKELGKLWLLVPILALLPVWGLIYGGLYASRHYVPRLLRRKASPNTVPAALHSTGAGRASTAGDRLDVVKGEIIAPSNRVLLWPLVVWVCLTLLQAAAVAWVWWAEGPVGLRVGGLCPLVVSLVVALLYSYSFIRRTWLVLGKDCLQCVTRRDLVVAQIPYRNMAAVKLERERGRGIASLVRGFVVSGRLGKEWKRIGIDVHALDDPGTCLVNWQNHSGRQSWLERCAALGEVLFLSSVKRFGWHYSIDDQYPLSLAEIHRRLVMRVHAAQAQDGLPGEVAEKE